MFRFKGREANNKLKQIFDLPLKNQQTDYRTQTTLNALYDYVQLSH